MDVERLPMFAVVEAQVEVRTLDIIAILIYLAGMAGIGLYFSRRNKDTEEYFVGGRSFPGWVLGLSMLSTVISSVTFLAFPGDAFQGDWKRLMANMSLPVIAVVAIVVFIPFFRRAKLTSAFEYLYARYGTAVRMYGVISFLILQLWRLARILFLVALPINVLTGAPLLWVIVCTGVFIAFYTIVGGIDAVIWTDAIQAVVLLLGGLVCIVYISLQLPGGFGQIIEVGREHDKFNMGQFVPPEPAETVEATSTTGDAATQNFFRWIMSDEAVWAILFLGIFEWLLNYAADQTVIQRYVAAKSLKEARKATALFSILALPTWILFFLVGTSVFAFYNQFPQLYSESLKADEVFPFFILKEIPAGIAGIVIAGVLAAAMSSLDSSINSLSTVAVIDLVKAYIAPGREDRFYLRVAHGMALFCGVFMILGALVIMNIMSEADSSTMNDLTWILSSIFGGCMVGLFMVGFFTVRVDARSATIAMLVAVAMNIYLGLNQMGWLPQSISVPVHKYWIVAIVNATFVITAYGLGRIRARKVGVDQEKLAGLTVWTLPKESEAI